MDRRSWIAADARRHGPGRFCASFGTSSISPLVKPQLLDYFRIGVVGNVGDGSFNSSHIGNYKPGDGLIW